MNTRFKHVAICSSAAILAAAAFAVNAEKPQAQKHKPFAAIAVDDSAEAQAIREDLQAQWEAAARAAGIDPETATADPPGNSDRRTARGRTASGRSE